MPRTIPCFVRVIIGLFLKGWKAANRSRVAPVWMGAWWLAVVCAGWPALSGAAPAWPASVGAALKKAGLPADALSVAVASTDLNEPPRWRLGADRPMNPASVMKLVTTYAALDLLGPNFTWRTRFWVDGAVSQGLLQGNLYIQGGGDPKFVMERIAVALQALQAQGVTVIHGDMVLDQSAFAPSAVDPAAFDGERLRPYNATPEALLVNFKSLVLGFVPDVVAGVARVSVEPPLAGVQVDAVVPLSDGGCGDWRGGLQARFDDPQQVRFSGSYASRCGERSWPVAYVDPSHFAQRALEGMWRAQGGLLTGQVRLGGVPSTARPLFEAPSLPLADIISDVNKFSNNIMAQQVFLTLGRVPVQARASSAALAPELEGVGSFERSRARLAQWWLARLGRQVPPPLLENGSGLSRDERITADGLLALLRDAAHHPQADVLARSLPVAGVDGTAARMGERGVLNQALGRAHIKTGSLRDVVAVAGYVEGQGRSPWAVVAIINHPQAAQGRPVLDAILEWAATLSPK